MLKTNVINKSLIAWAAFSLAGFSIGAEVKPANSSSENTNQISNQGTYNQADLAAIAEFARARQASQEKFKQEWENGAPKIVNAKPKTVRPSESSSGSLIESEAANIAARHANAVARFSVEMNGAVATPKPEGTLVLAPQARVQSAPSTQASFGQAEVSSGAPVSESNSSVVSTESIPECHNSANVARGPASRESYTREEKNLMKNGGSSYTIPKGRMPMPPQVGGAPRNWGSAAKGGLGVALNNFEYGLTLEDKCKYTQDREQKRSSLKPGEVKSYDVIYQGNRYVGLAPTDVPRLEPQGRTARITIQLKGGVDPETLNPSRYREQYVQRAMEAYDATPKDKLPPGVDRNAAMEAAKKAAERNIEETRRRMEGGKQ